MIPINIYIIRFGEGAEDLDAVLQAPIKADLTSSISFRDKPISGLSTTCCGSSHRANFLLMKALAMHYSNKIMVCDKFDDPDWAFTGSSRKWQ